ncbi:nucleoside phosphorylase [Youngiibacter fragilis]|uniref:Uridine phosphorylase n=1 Tax=Youngiibacter fragilis 232.1 TaxID=994573 RepID=V7I8T3_9CLOT|nr:nucleoside phosphorylase [Youngiibacter fragilis]ETA81432.1 phosphorylase [Youngiibacter fragilis 232.1]
MQDNQKMMHIALSKDQVGKYAFLPGSPERVPRIAAFLRDSEKVAQNREHTSYRGYIGDTPVMVVSTGMGGPSTAICLEELVKLGVTTFIRIGTCASTSALVERGDIVIPTGAVRMEGTSSHYLPLEYPSVPDYSLVKKIEEAAIAQGFRYNTGVTITKDSFYTQTEPETRPIGYELINKWTAYEKGGATSTSMEEALLFIAATSLGVRAASALISATNYKSYDQDNILSPLEIEKRVIITGVEAMRLVIEEDKRKSR